ncbi:transcriptional regulator [Salicibibacter kimchii]|uniref:Transcriptional regulator n=1 Tax=Salicibibacter kimchii TaxID=2099786 RepID=A0A345BWE5_9BACI|nr:transcriptional regulator [Salicibibacter kimchii]AXF55276.1 transcriptional regulator [Salicibibacter kimchii]
MAKGISYHNKDVLFKFLGELYKDATLNAFGIKGLPKIRQLLPTTMPKVRADERRTDTQFLLDDGSVLMLEYESNNRTDENHIKYLDYAQRILDREYQEVKMVRAIRLVVIYTSDVASVGEQLNAGDVGIQSKAVLLCEHNGDVILEKISDKIKRDDELTREELMQLSMLPLMHSTKSRKEMTRESVNLARNIPDEREQVQVIAGILTATDKFVDDEFSTKIREWLSMTKVGRIIEKEIEQEREAAIAENTRKLAKEMLKKMSAEEVADITGLDLEEVEKLKEEE